MRGAEEDPGEHEARQRLALSARQPLRLDGTDVTLRVLSGAVDIFVQPRAGGVTGARTHLFRVGPGGLILGLPSSVRDDGQGLEVLAVGGQGSEVQVIDRAGFSDVDLVDRWLLCLGGALADGSITRQAGIDGSMVLEAGDRVAGPSRGVTWMRVERGDVRVMDTSMVRTAAGGFLPLVAGTWIVSPGEAAVATMPGADVPPEAWWPGIEGFHALAMTLIEARIAREGEAATGRLRQRAKAAETRNERAFGDLARIIVPSGGAPPTADHPADALFTACKIVGDAQGIEIVRPAGPSTRHDFAGAVEIARASHVRLRRTLLRSGWLRRDAGPLVAWLGEERRPVAVVPISPRRYEIVEPQSGVRYPLDDAVAQTLSAEAVAFYRPLPAGDLTALGLLRWIITQSRGDVWRILLAAMALAVVALIAPVITALLVDGAIPRTDLGQLAFCTAALVIAAAGTAGFQAVQGVATLRLSGIGDWMLQAAVIDRLLRLPAAFFKGYTAGDLADRVLGVDEIRRVLTGRAIGGLLAGLFCLFGIAEMFVFNARLALVASALTLAHGVVIVVVSSRRLRHERRYFERRGKTHGLVLQMLTGVGKLRVAAATPRLLALWVRSFSAQKAHFTASQRAANLLTTFEAAFLPAATLAIFAFAMLTAGAGQTVDAGRFLAFFAAFGQSLGAVASLGAAIGETLIAGPFFERLRPVLSEPVESHHAREAAGEISGAVELSHVTFRYAEGGAPILGDLSLRVGQGEFVALVGPSGGGKSTIFRLLLGFERPAAGAILYDAREIDTLDIGSVRRQIGVVLQNGKLTAGSIYENICGAVQVPVEQVWEAARHAGLEADIQAMPMGLHTIVSDGVSGLSGGQGQRLMIARALVHRPRLLLFDEATSALDNHTQSIVGAALAKLNVTRIVIAHRLSTVRDADRILVISGGAVAQAGTFEQLSQEAGLFADLARRQLA